MICPRCGKTVPDGPECSTCGVVVTKFLARREQAHPAPNPADESAAPAQSVSVPALRSRSVVGRASLKARINLAGQLSRLLDAGIAPSEALLLAAQNSRAPMSAMLQRMRSALDSGTSFAQAAAGEPGLFSPDQVALIQAGEQTGGLPAAMMTISRSGELRLDLGRQIVRACIYPFVLFTLVFFVPKAHLVISSGWGGYLSACLAPYLASLAVLAGVFVVLPILLRWLVGPARIRMGLRRLPVVGNLLRLSATLRFSQHLGLALQAGLDLFSALRLAGQASADAAWLDRLGLAESRLRSGDTLHQALAATGLFHQDFLLMVASSERSGRLPDGLAQFAAWTQSHLLHRLNVTIQIASVLVLLATYFFVAQTVVSEFEQVLGGANDQMQQILKELGQPTGASRLPPELKELLKP
jgi:type II secretory pathway component PulF